MNGRSLLKISGAVLSLSQSDGAAVEEPHVPVVRIAELEIDPAQLESYKAAVKEEMETSLSWRRIACSITRRSAR